MALQRVRLAEGQGKAKGQDNKQLGPLLSRQHMLTALPLPTQCSSEDTIAVKPVSVVLLIQGPKVMLIQGPVVPLILIPIVAYPLFRYR